MGLFSSGVLRQGPGPGYVVRIDVENPCLRIGRRPAPLGPAVESGKYDGVFTHAEGNELSLAAKAPELRDRPPMHVGRSLAEKILGEQLAREWRRFCGQTLLRRGLLSRHIARRIIPALEGKQRLSVGAIEEKDEALFGRLGHGLDSLSFAVHGHQHWRRGKIAIPNVVPHSLKMPEALSGLCLQRDQAVGEQIVTDAVSSIKIERR